MNYIKLIPKALREAAYLKLVDELHHISEEELASHVFDRILAAARKVLAL